MINTLDDITAFLFENRDEKYRDFQAKLIPTIDKNTVIGVRVPILRKLAKELKGSSVADSFLSQLPHKYYEENCLHGYLIENACDYNKAIEQISCFLPYIDNWAVCDTVSPKVFKKHTPELYTKINEWISSKHTYTVRFGICMLMRYFLDEDFEKSHLQLVADISSDEYYINMMKAWYFATALAKQYDTAVVYIENKRLDIFTHNKAIQKAIESYRVSKEHKEHLRSYRIKA